ITPMNPAHEVRFIRICEEIITMNPRPAFVVIMGDLITNGKLEEYQAFRKVIKRLDQTGVPWYIVMGNHDRRQIVFQAFPEKKSEVPEVPGKQILNLETPKIRFLFFDSRMDDSRAWMAEKDKYPNRRPWDGTMDDKSRKYLTDELIRSDKPTVVGTHHEPESTHLTQIMKQYPCAKLYIYGHTHQYRSHKVDGITVLSCPSLADNRPSETDPIGYIIMTVEKNDLILTLQTLDKKDSRNGIKTTISLNNK
ncbi:MAG: metallophosphoesterase, partial [Planctomycetia bacterium]|nr:metallophosphoesterase [Planctomycetia bacterium]